MRAGAWNKVHCGAIPGAKWLVPMKHPFPDDHQRGEIKNRILMFADTVKQGCINSAILLSGIGAHGVSSKRGEYGDVFLFSNLGAL